MDAIILDKNLQTVDIVDVYESFIWTDRYDEAGDFELHIPIDKTRLSSIQKGYYVWCEKSENVMIVETINIESDIEEGAVFTVSGKSLKSILNRRIIWNRTTFERDKTTKEKPKLQNGIKQLLEENAINPAISTRKIPNLIFEESTDEKITSLEFEAQYFGEGLYDTIVNLCRENEIGWKLTLNSNKQFVFKLYAGVDRSFEQSVNPYVIFSPSYDNILNTNYLDSNATLKNVTLVAGEEETDKDNNTTCVTYVLGNAAGLDRREIFTDASGTSSERDGVELTADEYKAHLRQKGIDTLIENTETTAFEGEVDYTMTYEYGVDYFIGDIVQIANEYGHEGRAYISEFVISCDRNGLSTYPTFKTIQKGVYEE